MSENYYGFDLDDSWDEMWHEAERVQDGFSGHHIAFKGYSAHEAARRMATALIPFIEKNMYLSDADGHNHGITEEDVEETREPKHFPA